MVGEELQASLETPPNSDSSLAYGSERIRGRRDGSLERTDKALAIGLPRRQSFDGRKASIGRRRLISSTGKADCDADETWPAGTIFTYEPGVAGGLFLSEGLDSCYEDFFLPGKY